MLVQGLDAIQAYSPFQQRNVQFLPYRDAGKGASLYQLHVIDVLKGIHKARQLGWVDFKTFDVKTYEYYEKVENGDWNWIVPGKFLAFATPRGWPAKSYELKPGSISSSLFCSRTRVASFSFFSSSSSRILCRTIQEAQRDHGGSSEREAL